jgi:D-xylose transport system substrate-binding protein
VHEDGSRKTGLESLDRLTDALVSGQIDRRTFLRRGIAAAFTLPTLAAIMAACSSSTASSTPAASAASTATPAATVAPTSASTQPLVGFLLRDMAENRWNYDAKGFENECKKLGVPYIVQFTPDGTVQSQTTIAENMIAQGIKALVFCEAVASTPGAIINDCKAAGVKCISYGNVVPDVDYITNRDNVKVGAIFAQAAVAYAPKGNYVLIYGGQGNDVAESKKTGIWQVLQPLVNSGDIKVVEEQYVQWLPAPAQAVVEAALAATNNNIVAVIASNDNEAQGAFAAVKAAGLEHKVFITGEDGDLARVQLIAAGYPAVTTWENYVSQGALAADIAVDLAQGKPLPPSTTSTVNGVAIPTFQVVTSALTKDTIMAQLVESGYYAYNDVYSLVPASDRPPQPSPSA